MDGGVVVVAVQVELGVAVAVVVGAAGAFVKLSSWGLPPARPAGRMLEGEPAQQAKELVSLLRNEAKVL